MAIIDLPVLVGQLPLPPGLAGVSNASRRRTNLAQTVFCRNS